VLLVVIASSLFIFWSFKDIFNKNKNTAAPFFRFFENVTPTSLRGEGDGRVNYLILGYGGEGHSGEYLTDTIIVASVNPYSKKLALLSIPRDLYVPIPNQGQRKINEAFSIGKAEGSTDQGAQLVKETLSNILDIPLHYYITLNFEGFEKIIDLVGGVDVYVEKDIYDPYYPDDRGGQTVYYIEKGWHHFNGSEALKYARSRYTTSDFDRSKRQQKIMIALKEKVLSLNLFSDTTKILSLLSTVGKNVETDLTPKEIIKSFELVKDLPEDKIATKVLDNSQNGLLYSSSINGMYVLLPKDPTWEEVRALAHSIFTEPFIEKENARIVVENGTGIEGMAFKVYSFLKNRGYQVVEYKTAESLSYKTKIIDYSQGEKPYTLEFLKRRFFNPEVVKPQTMDKEVDFVIILGQDFDYTIFTNTKI
jgi:LCP family protein required for cell wall assembly